jgi:DMSO/TMAO reductase YedYZ molybdopterin-dependent catalytic subunit
MAVVSPGFSGRRRGGAELPPGQYLTREFPVLSAGPTPQVLPEHWEFTVTTETGEKHRWDWATFTSLPAETITRDLHCVTRWSKLGTNWKGVSLDLLLADVESSAGFAMAHSYGGYTTNLPIADLLDGQAWIAYQYDGKPLTPEHGGPARLLVPHLYLWKSAKWVRGLVLSEKEDLGFWENVGYHEYGDPWKEQRYAGD